jgi:hypothetical protein
MTREDRLKAVCDELAASPACDAWDLCWKRLFDEFGPPSSHTQKTFRWTLDRGILEVALTHARAGTIVIPFDTGRDQAPYFAEHRPPRRDSAGHVLKEGRHSNVASFSPSLGWDRDVLYIRPQSVWELDRTVEIIRQRRDGHPIRDLPPPDDDPPLQRLLPNASLIMMGPSSSTRRVVYHRDGGRCRRCGSTEDLEFDHIVPRAKGGSDSANNLELLCLSCNRRKSDNI